MPKDIHKVHFLKTMAGFTINIKFGLFGIFKKNSCSPRTRPLFGGDDSPSPNGASGEERLELSGSIPFYSSHSSLLSEHPGEDPAHPKPRVESGTEIVTWTMKRH